MLGHSMLGCRGRVFSPAGVLRARRFTALALAAAPMQLDAVSFAQRLQRSVTLVGSEELRQRDALLFKLVLEVL
jgi:hypothetical protein